MTSSETRISDPFGDDSLVPTLRIGTQPSDAPRQFLDAERRRKPRSHAEHGHEEKMKSEVFQDVSNALLQSTLP